LFAGGTTEPAAKGVVLKHSNWRPEDLDKWGAIYAEFMKDNPDIQLVDDPMPADRYFNNMEINAEGGQLISLSASGRTVSGTTICINADTWSTSLMLCLRLLAFLSTTGIIS
jgi:hypothetical protein